MAITDNDITKNFFYGFIRLHILYHASRGPVFGLKLMQELAKHGYSLSPGTLYPILHQMESSGFLSSRGEVVNGKWRKYYRTTASGKRVLTGSYEKMNELINELIE
jgi:DNA-binding PadR family transcriptional regulator